MQIVDRGWSQPRTVGDDAERERPDSEVRSQYPRALTSTGLAFSRPSMTASISASTGAG
jgi:hypothetical protein